MQSKRVASKAADWLTQRDELHAEELLGTTAVAPHPVSLVTCTLGQPTFAVRFHL
jgi:hypothetical protein